MGFLAVGLLFIGIGCMLSHCLKSDREYQRLVRAHRLKKAEEREWLITSVKALLKLHENDLKE